jgi:hypothetical protein
VLWTKARASRFILIWGVLFFGGGTFVWSLVDESSDGLPWTWNAGLHLLMGLMWGWLMWLFLNWLSNRRKMQQ